MRMSVSSSDDIPMITDPKSRDAVTHLPLKRIIDSSDGTIRSICPPVRGRAQVRSLFAPELALEDLPRWIARQEVEEGDVLWDLEAGKLGAAVF